MLTRDFLLWGKLAAICINQQTAEIILLTYLLTYLEIKQAFPKWNE